MSYKIEISAATLVELGGKLLAMGQQLTVAHNPVMPEVTEADKRLSAAIINAGGNENEAAPARTRKPRTEPAAVQPEPPVAEAPAEPGPQAAKEQAPAEAEPPVAEAPVAVDLDYQRDVVPLVLETVKVAGLPVVKDILGEFGVEKASQIDAALWPELVAILKAELAKS